MSHLNKFEEEKVGLGCDEHIHRILNHFVISIFMSLQHNLRIEWSNLAEDVQRIMEHEKVVGVLIENEVDEVFNNLLLCNVFILIQDLDAYVRNLEPGHLHIHASRASILLVLD